MHIYLGLSILYPHIDYTLFLLFFQVGRCTKIKVKQEMMNERQCSAQGTKAYQTTSSKSITCLAIHFGRSYSRCVFSFQTQQLQDTIMTFFWDGEYGQRTCKTPTSILFDEDQKFLAFGYDAMKKYTWLTSKLNRKKHYLFEHFMKELYEKVSIHIM